MNRNQRGERNCRWNGGRRIHQYGYIYVRAPKNHPFRYHDGYILEHRLIMEQKLNRYLQPEERVHHLNGVNDDNRIENLILFKNDIEHKKYH